MDQPNTLAVRTGSSIGAATAAPAEFTGFRDGRRLQAHALGSRWLVRRALFNEDGARAEAFVVYQITTTGQPVDPRSFLRATDELRKLDHPHILPTRYAWVEPRGACLLATPYVGNAEGLLSLDRLLRLKPDGRLAPFETRHLAVQALSAMTHAHERGISHGKVNLDDVLVDPRGSVKLELYGLASRLAGRTDADSFEQAAEVRSLVELAFRAATGRAAGEASRPALRHLAAPDRGLSDWFERGLHPKAGFDTATEALRALPPLAGRPLSEPKPASRLLAWAH